MSRGPLRGREAYRAWRTLDTRWADNDAYGHVNNVVYYAWFDTAVNAWLIDQGLLDVASGDPIGLVVETGCRYFSELAFPDRVAAGLRVGRLGTSSVRYEIGLAVERLGTSSVTYRLGVFAKDAAHAAAEGHFTHVYVARDSRRPVALPQSWREKFAAVQMGG